MTEANETVPPVPPTIVEVFYPPHRGKIGIRGSFAPLSWDHTQAPDEQDGDRHVFRVALPKGELLELKVVRNEEEWAGGRNYTVHDGDNLQLEPYFEWTSVRLEAPATLEIEGRTLRFQVLLPPSYGEQENKRYPVLYAQDGQSLWSSSGDPFGVWNLDAELDRLYDLGAIEEIIVVGIDTSEDRTERLSPMVDKEYGGGQAGAHLAAIVDHLIPHINASYRTRPAREHTGVLGSSMGGLFSFYAAWTRPDVFGKAACLSSSFWWADRAMVRLVQGDACPAPRPLLYIDSGAAWSALERDVSARDGFHHTRSMFRALTAHCYTAGVDLHRFVYTGATHDAPSWQARIAVPLQILFPQDGGAPTSS
jgi:enterochelin esterase-like enzyme